MNERHGPTGDDRFDELRRVWKNTRAPAGLAPKVMASLAEPMPRVRAWRMSWAVVAAMLVVAVVTSTLILRPGGSAGSLEPDINLPPPSLAAINRAAGGKPSMAIPAFGQVKTPPAFPGIPKTLPREWPEPTTSLPKEYDDEISNQTWIT